MFRYKPVFIALMLALWGASVVVMFKSTAPSVPVAQAAGEVKAKIKISTVDTIEVSFGPITSATAYKIERSVNDGAPLLLQTVNATSDNPNTYVDSRLPNGKYKYIVTALNNLDPNFTSPSATSNDVSITASTVTTDVTPPPGGGGPAASKSPFLGGECKQADAAAKVAAKSKPFKNTIYETIDNDGVKQVYKWTLSLVNLLVLFFLLIIAFSNILRLNIDTYAVQKVFTPLILGVLLANFGWLICRFFLEISTILYHALTDPYKGLSTSSADGGAGLFNEIAQKGYGFGNICSIAKGDTIGLGGSLLGSFVGTAMMLVAGVLFLTLYALLVARVWIITLLMVISPLAFLALGFPMTSQYFKKWWSLFFNWVFMAPASFLILVLAYKMADIGDGPNLTKYIIITGLLYFAVQVPFKMGGEWMQKWGGYVSQFKKKSGQLAQTAADKSTKGIREGASKNLQRFAWDTKLGQRIAAGQKRRQLKTTILDDRLAKAHEGGQLKYLKNKKGSELNIKAANARLEKEVEELDVKQQDIKAEGEARMRKITRDKGVVAAQAEVDRIKKETDAKLRQLANSNQNYKQKLIDRDARNLDVANMELAIKQRERDIEQQLQVNPLYQNGTAYDKNKMLQDELGNDLRHKRLKTVRDGRKAQLNNLQSEIDIAETPIKAAQLAAENKLDQNKKRASEHSFEAEEARISVDDALKENTSEIKALFSQTEGGKWIDDRRAMWRTHIATQEKIAEAELQKEYYTMFKGNPTEKKAFADRVGKTVEEIDEMNENHFTSQLNAQQTKELADREATKGVEKVVQQIVHIQMIPEKIRIAGDELRLINDNITRLAAINQAGVHDAEINALNNEKAIKESAIESWEKQKKSHIDELNQKIVGHKEMIGKHLENEYEYDQNGNVIDIKEYGGVNEKQGKPRRALDRLLIIAEKGLREKATNDATNLSATEFIREWDGIGNDVKNAGVIPALMRGDSSEALRLVGGMDNVRDVGKALAKLHGGVKVAGQWTDPRSAALRRDLITNQKRTSDEVFAQIVSEIAKDSSADQFIIVARNAMTTVNGKLQLNGDIEKLRKDILEKANERGKSNRIMGAYTSMLDRISRGL